MVVVGVGATQQQQRTASSIPMYRQLLPATGRRLASLYRCNRYTHYAHAHGAPRPTPLPPCGVHANRTSFAGWSAQHSTRRILNIPNAIAEPTVTSDAVHSASVAANNTDPADPVKHTPVLTFQDAIAKLQDYWASVGCAVWLPHNTEVGAGTMNPATFLRVLGPEPWNVCYAEPSIRPDDSRYGDNPNRVQRHTQFQVILKPDPGNPQELYLGSLEALGIDTRAHDVRFVEDNWESPVLGAWGLGWEVWLDGMEVTQFTYFQQAGGKPLSAPAVEITYGLERILMNLQGVHHFKDIVYAPGITYGELFMQNEYEMSVYNLDEADVEDQRARFVLFEKEAKRLLERRLPIPAFDHLLKLSHTFNILDARGAVGVTERANSFAALRALARQVTALWLERREELEHPLGVIPPLAGPPEGALPEGVVEGPTSPFVLEVGSEELPPEDVESVMVQLRDALPGLLTRLRLQHGDIQVVATPRRVAVVVDALAAKQPDVEERIRGPPVKAAYDAQGAPTKALEGFCRKNNIDPATCTSEPDTKGVEYIWATVAITGQPAAVALTPELSKVLASLSFTRSMRWNGEAVYSRPVRWLVAMHGDVVLPVTFAGLVASGKTRVLRTAEVPEIEVPHAGAYTTTLTNASIILDPRQRRQHIWDGVQSLVAQVGGHCPAVASEGLLQEVTNLVEAPTVLLGSFEERFLALPRELLVMVMRKHQRYFPIYASDAPDAPLLPYFITVANGPVNEEAVVQGNQAVLRARFEDATFFYTEDLKTTLEQLVPRLQGTMFQQQLGTLLDKTNRVHALITPLAPALGLGDAQDTAATVARLARADLASSTVMEMTALAGVMGRHYALKQGLGEEIAQGVFESVLPRQAGDVLPSSPAGILGAIADRVDSLVGLFAAGCAPTASADPYGLRRIAYGMLQTAVANNVTMDLKEVLSLAAAQQPIQVTEDVQQAAWDFVVRRLEQLLVDEGLRVEAVRAVLSQRGNNPALAAVSARNAHVQLQQGEGALLQRVLAAMARPVRIMRGKDVDQHAKVDPALFELPEEQALYDALVTAQAVINPTMPLGEFLEAAEGLVAPTDAFFDKVFVMCEDAAVRSNRLALLRDVAALPVGIIDFAELPGF